MVRQMRELIQIKNISAKEKIGGLTFFDMVSQPDLHDSGHDAEGDSTERSSKESRNFSN